MSKPSKFWDRIAARYARQPVADQVAYEEKLRVTRSFFPPEAEVLEFGCGTGSTALAHAPYVRRIRASDFSARMIEIARRKAAEAGVTNVEFEQSAIDELQVQDASVDVVMGMSILHLLPDKEAAIARAYRMLKPGGVFVSSTICLSDANRLFRIIAPIGHFLRLIPLVKIFSQQELVSSMTDAGFTIERQWQPARGKAVFIVARVPERTSSA